LVHYFTNRYTRPSKIRVPAKQQQQGGVTMALAFAEQRSNNNKNEKQKQEEVNQGLNEAMVGVVKELVAVLEGRTRAIQEEMRVHAAARINAALAWLVEQTLAMPRRVAPEWRRYYRFRRRRRWWRNREQHMHAHGDGDGGGRTIRSRRKSNSGPSMTFKDPFCRALRLIYLIIYFCFQVSSHEYDIAVIVFPLIKLATSTVQHDDLSREYDKSNDGLATFRISSLWQYMVFHTYALLTKAREP
jgi:hypothetical protein